MATRLGNPFAFTPYPVTFFVSVFYVAILASLLFVHHVVPPAPSSEAPAQGLNLTEAWRDLQYLSNGFHPYNSHRNDDVRNWLLSRIEQILDRNGVRYSSKGLHATKAAPVVLYNDLVSNVTFSSSSTSIYFEGTNIMVYIRGSEDVPDDVENSGVGGVLVNAHYDSVSTGFGATDDGVGVITVLQLISYFTTRGNQPKRGIVALLNNGEEDWLNGAKAFTEHPLSFFPHTFLNLEGAGAGGRATLFRSTDTEVTRFYQKAKQPFGSVLSADGFKRGLIRSGTDYSIFTADMNMRGLDVAFMEPRAQYHTVEDSARDTSLDSVWHMLSGAVETMKGLTSYTGTEFEGEPDGTGQGSNGVWFDLFGEGFAVFELHTLFAFSVTLLVVTPLVFIALTATLAKVDKFYLFARKKYLHSSDDDEAYRLYGWRGFFRFPIAFVVATAAVVGLAYLITKVNPNIVYSSQYSVWSMMLSAYFCITWFILRGGAAMRPSALTRTYGLLWIYSGAYVLLVLATVAENNFHLAGIYFIVIYFASAFFALLISYLELFSLPKKKTYVQHVAEASESPGSRTPGSIRTTLTPTSSRPLTAATAIGDPSAHHKVRDDRRNSNEDDDATETTSLLRSEHPRTFSRGYGSSRHGSRRASLDARSVLSISTSRRRISQPEPTFPGEQNWSGKLPRWTWFFQLLLLVPINIILVGQVALLITSALHQTLADGSSALTVYLLIAIFAVLLLVPALPFLHRFSVHIPSFLFLVFIGTLIYNLVAFPFSPANKLKVYFIQRVDLDTGINEASLTGLDGFVQTIIAELPSAAGQAINCGPPDTASRAGLVKCSWQGITPAVVPRDASAAPPGNDLKYLSSWVQFNASRTRNEEDDVDSLAAPNTAQIDIVGRNTRACRLFFDPPVTDLTVRGASDSGRYPHTGSSGANELRLWSREWERPFTVDIGWDASDEEGNRCRHRRCRGRKASDDDESGDRFRGLDGKAQCIWSDANEKGLIPALDEIRTFIPRWAIVSKLSDGLVEGTKRFAL
ncbi:endoplasmic reticulum metallopeptidase 1 [Macrophomina phaseolina]|uniref:Peptide hydrolase n=1 Tax=Macrophomina phaseolina TaxID=35725 RepID=A0ABQ8G816_9PEZI|nr:endoplasmic reticulum metallopeptidase 1 [Macrophomina phaseolina]